VRWRGGAAANRRDRVHHDLVDSDYPRLWQQVNKNNANRYISYQSKTSRPIPIFTLTPRQM
jgi:F420H(2)-dependent quinone reductase